jgi:hypothetical protein
MKRPDHVSIGLRPALYDKAKLIAEDRGISIAQLFRDLLEAVPLPKEESLRSNFNESH